jgi:hypothetical protein
MSELVFIPTDKIDQVWPMAAPHLERAIRYSAGESELSDVQELCSVGRFHLWLGWDADNKEPIGAGVTEIVDFPRMRICFLVLWASDAPREEWIESLQTVEKWAREQGCSKTRLLGRKGWLKILPEYRPQYYLLERTL